MIDLVSVNGREPTYRALFAETRRLGSLRGGIVCDAHQLPGPKRKATTRTRRGLVRRVLDPGAMELCDELVDLLGATDQDADRQLVIRTSRLDLTYLIRIVPK